MHGPLVVGKRLWKRPHPSEDGEALPEISHKMNQLGPRPQLHSPVRDAPQPSKWFALHTNSRHEKRVAEHLGHRDIECYLPLYRSQRKWADGSRVALDLPLFPGYLFVHIRRGERVTVLTVPGVLALVGGTGGEPAALPDSTIDALRRGLTLQTALPHSLMTAGQRVRIRSGAFAGLEGIVARNKNCCRVVLTLEHIMQSYAIEVDLEDLELLAPADRPRPDVRTDCTNPVLKGHGLTRAVRVA
jgi:transcriptional antiterminator RfaH